MESQELILKGYTTGVSKKNEKNFYRLDFMSKPIISNDKMKAFCTNVSIFVPNEQEYLSFIKSHTLLSVVKVNAQIFGNSIRYTI